jgi:CRISPR-associated exonuclease Cas4
MLVLVGPNNSGKSNILRAIEFGLSASAKPNPEDFFSFRSEDELWVEMTFDRLTEQEESTFREYLSDDKTIRIQKIAKLGEDGKIEIEYKGYVQKSDHWQTIPKNTIGGGGLPEFLLIPAVRELSKELETRTTAFFGRILRLAMKIIVEQEEDSQEEDSSEVTEQIRKILSKKSGALAWLEEKLNSRLGSWNTKVKINITPLDIEKLLELSTQLHLDDGVETPPERKGHGLQRAVLFELVRVWAESLGLSGASTRRRVPDSVFFAIEEPEIFLHPHAQRQLMASLVDIAKDKNYQVFISTHSTHFIDLEDYGRIAILTKPSPEEGTQVKQCTQNLFTGQDAENRKRRFHMAAWVNPDRSELFFAQKVVLVEGETEKAVLPFLAKKLGCFDPAVSVIDCGSKGNLPLYIQILNAFGIHYFVLHDEDSKYDKLNQEIQRLVDKNLGEVEVLSPNFHKVAGISRKQAEKKGNALAALDHFYQMDVKDLPERIVNIVQKAYRVRRENENELR